jgi:hypothetical protein
LTSSKKSVTPKSSIFSALKRSNAGIPTIFLGISLGCKFSHSQTPNLKIKTQFEGCWKVESCLCEVLCLFFSTVFQVVLDETETETGLHCSVFNIEGYVTCYILLLLTVITNNAFNKKKFSAVIHFLCVPDCGATVGPLFQTFKKTNTDERVVGDCASLVVLGQ